MFLCLCLCPVIIILIAIVLAQVLEEGRASFQNMNPAEESSSAASNVLFWWQLFTGTLLFSFALSCVSQFAQFYQMTIDQEASDKLREHLPPSVRTSLLSPGGSGRLVLPPPTPKTMKKSPKNSLRSGKKPSLSPMRSSPKDEND